MLSFTSWNPTSHREYRKSSPTTFSKLTSSFFKAVTFRGKNQEKEGTQTSEKVKMPSMHLPNRPTGVLALFSRKPDNPPALPAKRSESKSMFTNNSRDHRETSPMDSNSSPVIGAVIVKTAGPIRTRGAPIDPNEDRSLQYSVVLSHANGLFSTHPIPFPTTELLKANDHSNGSKSVFVHSPFPPTSHPVEPPCTYPGDITVDTVAKAGGICLDEGTPRAKKGPNGVSAMTPTTGRSFRASNNGSSCHEASKDRGDQHIGQRGISMRRRYFPQYRSPRVVVDPPSSWPFDVAETEEKLRLYAMAGDRQLYLATAMSARGYGYIAGADHILRRSSIPYNAGFPSI